MVKSLVAKSISFNGAVIAVKVGSTFPWDELSELYPDYFEKVTEVKETKVKEPEVKMTKEVEQIVPEAPVTVEESLLTKIGKTFKK